MRRIFGIVAAIVGLGLGGLPVQAQSCTGQDYRVVVLEWAPIPTGYIAGPVQVTPSGLTLVALAPVGCPSAPAFRP